MRSRWALLELTGVLGAAAVLFSRGLDAGPNYDEGVYLASADALREGQRLGEDVFASQPPGFYLLTRLALALPGESIRAERVLFLVVAALGVGAAWAIGRMLAGRPGGIVAALVLLTAPAYPTQSVRVAADTPSVAFALGGLALLIQSSRGGAGAPGWAAAAGAVLAAAVAIKLLAVVALVPAVALLLLNRAPTRLVGAFAAGAAAVTLALLAVYANSIGPLYRDAVAFHADARGLGDGPAANLERVARSFDPHRVFTLLAALGLAAWLARGARPRSLVPIWAWAIASALFLAWQRPLLDHHFVLFSASVSIAVGAALGRAIEGRRLALGLVFLLCLAGYAQQWRRTDRLGAADPAVARAAAEVARSLPSHELFVTDVPLVAHLAGRGLPGELVDTSAVRFASGSLTAACVLELVDRDRVELVVVGRSFRTVPGLRAALEARFPRHREVGDLQLLRRARPAAARAAPPAGRGSCSRR